MEIIVDHCEKADLKPDGTVADDKMCRRFGTTPEENKFLNVKSLLQLGGRYSTPNYPGGVTQQRFDGCIKNFEHNGKVRWTFETLELL